MYIWFSSIKIDKHMLFDTLTVFLSTKLCRQWSWLSPILAWSTKTNIHCKYIRSHVACKHTILVSIFVTILFNSTSSVVYFYLYMECIWKIAPNYTRRLTRISSLIHSYTHVEIQGNAVVENLFLCLLIQRTCIEPMSTRSVLLSIMQ